MKYILFILFLITTGANAQSNDTTAYTIQRLKVNNLLAQRSAKFGQYDISLNARTGIFGFQTKADIRRSNEILRNIALNDNEIFKELKILMDYKDMKAQQIQSGVAENNIRITSYRQAIKRLQDKNEQIEKENESLKGLNAAKNYLSTFLLIALMGMTYIFYKKFRKTQLK